jgi:hypothetical protein
MPPLRRCSFTPVGKREKKRKKKKKEKRQAVLLTGIEPKEIVALQRGYQLFVTDRAELFAQPYHCAIDRSE